MCKTVLMAGGLGIFKEHTPLHVFDNWSCDDRRLITFFHLQFICLFTLPTIHTFSFCFLLSIGCRPNLIWILILLMIQVQPMHMMTISRINYGTIFEKYSDVYFSAEHWTHTFVFKLEKPEYLNPFWAACNCTNINDMFHPDYKYVFSELSQLHNNTLTDVDNTIENIFKLIPSHNKHISRRRRAILPIIGSISRSLFGIGTVEEIEKLANVVNRIKHRQDKVIDGFSHEIDILHSVIGATDHRINNLVKGIKLNNMALTRIDNEFKTNIENAQQKTSWVMSVLIDQMHKTSQITQIFSKLMLGIHGLLQNKLTTNLVPYSTLEKTLQEIQHTLAIKRPGFQLLFTDPHFYYRHENVFFFRHENEIMVTLKFPIGKLHKPMTLLKVQMHKVPVHTSSNHATAILDLPTYLAVSKDLKFYSNIQNKDIQNCHKYNKVIFCNHNTELIPESHWTCSFALFKDNQQEIKNTCNFRFLPHGIMPTVKLINQTHLLIYNTSELNLQCYNGMKTINGCFFCLMTLPCNCSLNTKQLYVPERWTGCHEQTTNISLIHPVNLAILQEFFHPKQLVQISSHSTFPVPLNVSIPQFKLQTNNISEIVANDHQDHLNLRKIIQLSKQNKVIFSSLAEAIMPNETLNTKAVSVNLILSIIATVLALLATGFLIILFRKYRYICLALAAHQLLPEAAAFPSLPSFYYTMSTEKTMTTTYPALTLAQISDTSTMYLVAFTVCILVVVIVRKILNSKFKTILVLEITDGIECIRVNVQTLPANIASCHFSGVNVLKNITLTASIIPKLTINWGDLTITNSMFKTELQLQSTIRLNPYKGVLLKKVLSNKFSMFIWISHNNVCIPIKLCQPMCKECSPQGIICAGTSNSGSNTPLLK